MRYMIALLAVLGFATVRGINFSHVIVAILISLVVGAIITICFWKEGKWENRKRPFKAVTKKASECFYSGKINLCRGKGNRIQPATQKVAAPSLIRAH